VLRIALGSILLLRLEQAEGLLGAVFAIAVDAYQVAAVGGLVNGRTHAARGGIADLVLRLLGRCLRVATAVARVALVFCLADC